MTDDLVKRLWLHDCEGITREAADRIEELEAKLSESEALLAKAVGALTVIDALDPEGLGNGCSQSALIGLVLRMGEIARTTLAELTGGKDD